MTIRVFVSYRRSDSSHVSGRLRDRLSDAFSETNVFYDVDSVPFGADFRRVVKDTLAKVDVVVVMIGAKWDTQRLKEPNDYVRLEVAEALNQQKLVVPVLLDGTPIPLPEDLPPELRALAYLNAAPLRRDPDFRRDADRIIDSLRESLHPLASKSDKSATSREPARKVDTDSVQNLLSAYVDSRTTGNNFEVVINSGRKVWKVSYMTAPLERAKFTLDKSTSRGDRTITELKWINLVGLLSVPKTKWKVTEFDVPDPPNEHHARLAVLHSAIYTVRPAAFWLAIDGKVLISQGNAPPASLLR